MDGTSDRTRQFVLGHRLLDPIDPRTDRGHLRVTYPAQLVERLNAEINTCLGDPNIKARLAELGGTTIAGSSADFGNLIVEETAKWGKVVKYAGIKSE